MRMDEPRSSAIARAGDATRSPSAGPRIVARYFVQTSGRHLVRRLVTLGTPYLALQNPGQELAVFGSDDALVPPPYDRLRRRMRVIEACGHLGLLTDGRVLEEVVRYLRPPTWAANRAADAAA